MSLKIEEMWTKWEPAPPITKPWSSMENSTKEEYLKKIKGYGKKSRNESDSYNLDDGFVVDDDDVVHRTDSGDSDEDMGDWKEETPTNSDSYEPVSALKRKPSNRSSPPTNKKRRFETEAVSSSGSSFPEAHTTRIARSSARSISYKEISDSPYEPENAEDEHPRTTKGANTRMEEHTEGTRGLISGLISGLGAGFRRPALMDSKLKHEVIYISD